MMRAVAIATLALCWGFSGPRVASAQCSSLIEGARRGDTDCVVKEIVLHDKVDATDEHGATALHWAARGGHADVARILLKERALPEMRLEEDVPMAEGGGGMLAGDTPLGIAVRSGHLDVVKTLLDRLNAAQVNARNHASKTAVILAAESGQTEILDALIEANASLNLTGGDPDATALYHAARDGHIDAVRRLLEAGAEPNAGVSPEDPRRGGESPRRVARRHGHWQIVELIFKASGIPTWLRFLVCCVFALSPFVLEELWMWSRRLGSKSTHRHPFVFVVSFSLAVIVFAGLWFRSSDLFALTTKLYSGSIPIVTFVLFLFSSGVYSFVQSITQRIKPE